MFKVNDRIAYSSVGVCEITDITENDLTSVMRKYYVIIPLNDNKSLIYVPVDNEKLTGRMRKLPTKSELKKLMSQSKKESLDWIENSIERNEYFQSVVNDGDILCTMQLFYTLCKKENELSKLGKSLKKSDERIYKECIKILCGEMSCIMDIDLEKSREMLLENYK